MKKLLVALLVVFVCGCAPKTMYTWDRYDKSLYKYYKNPTELEDFRLNLVYVIEKAEKRGNIPPGIYAEYGYVLFEQKQYQESIVYFEKEKAAWPESVVIMNKMIDNSKKAMAATS